MAKLKIIATSDIHGYIYPSEYREKNEQAKLGLARISSAIKKYREQGPVLLLDNGDSFQGSPLLTYYHDHSSQYQNPIADSFNYLNYDYINLGNHDFNYGQKRLETFIAQNNCPILTNNILVDQKPLGASKIIEFKGNKIAIIGVCTHFIPNWERPEHIENMQFLDAKDSLEQEVTRLKDQVDLVIALYHGGFERDLETNEATEMITGENQGSEMLKIEGLDILITGHQHRSLAQKVNGITLSQTAFKAQEFAVYDVNFSSETIKVKLESSADYPVDKDLLKLFDPLEAKTQVWLDQEIGYLNEGPLIIEDEFQARIKKHPLISLMNQIQMEKTGAMISSNAMFNQAKGFEQKITMRDLVNTYPYPNTLVLKEIDGANLKLMLERSAEYFSLDQEGEIIISDKYFEPKPQHYNYDMVDGIDYTINVKKEIGSRITNLKYQGKDVLATDRFTIVVNNYRAMGGGKYWMIRNSKTLKVFQEDMVEIMLEYFKKYPKVTINHRNNIKVVAE